MNWAIEKKSYSQRRASGLVGMAPRAYRYASRRGDDEGVRVRLRELAAIRRRFGYRRLHILLERGGVTVNHKKLYRIYREERQTVLKRGRRKRALGTRAPMAIPQGRNQRWSLDFVSDTFVDGRRFRVLVVVDDITRECLTLVADTSLSGVRIARELDRLVALRGWPAMLVSDRLGPGNDPMDRFPEEGHRVHLTCRAGWSETNRVEWHDIAPGKPMRDTASSSA